MPGEVLPRGMDESARSRLSSFGFSGTIAHALVALDRARVRSSMGAASDTSLYRHTVLPVGSAGCGRLVARPRLAEARGALRDGAVVSAEALISHHVVGGSILLPGAVGYVEAAFVADARPRSALSAIAFVRGAARERCASRRTRLAAGAFEIGRRARMRRKETVGAATGCLESPSTHLETRPCAW